MIRLRDSEDLDPVEAEAARLLGSVAPIDTSDERRARLRARFARRHQRSKRVARLVVGALALVGSAAFASVSLHRRWTATKIARPALGSSPLKTATTAEHRAAAAAPDLVAAPRAVVIAPDSPSADASPSPLKHSRAGSEESHPRAKAVDHALPPLPPAPASTSSAPDAELVVRALKGMRGMHDPKQAEPLLDEYLMLHPDGALAEEALSLAIEAAVMRHDPRSAELSALYLERYPAGRFAVAARRARAGGAN